MKLFFLLWFNLSAQNVVAIGDIHGDYNKVFALLKKINLIDTQGNWIGGNNILVQTGDQIDRGPDDRKVIDFFEQLQLQAASVGGSVYSLLGNHEMLNSVMDFSYVNDDAYIPFNEFREYFLNQEYSPSIFHTLSIVKGEKSIQGRAVSFAPKGVYANILANRKSILVLSEILFVHGGVLPNYAKLGIERLNKEASYWLTGKLSIPPEWIADRNGPFWSRLYSDGIPKEEACQKAEETLKLVKAKYMIVGHTIQKEINSVCNGKVWRIDTGMSSGFDKKNMGTPQALIYNPRQDTFNIIKAE